MVAVDIHAGEVKVDAALLGVVAVMPETKINATDVSVARVLRMRIKPNLDAFHGKFDGCSANTRVRLLF
jgi:hypothetical protein